MANKKVVKSIQRNINKDIIYQERVKTVKSRKHTAEELPLLINPIDTPDNPLTYSRLMEWLANTGWVYGYIRKRLSPMDAYLYQDIAQSIWLSILEVKQETMMRVWYTGKGKFINYIKRVVDTQLRISNGPNYNTNKRFHRTHYLLTDEQWKAFEEGSTNSTFIDTFPVRYNCPSGNRAKMVRPDYEELPIHVDPDFDMSDSQMNFPDTL